MPTPSPTRYRTTNWSAYNASLRKRGALSIGSDPDMAWRSPDEVRPTAQPKPSKPRYRTVPDPLEAVTDMLKVWFEADPGVTGRQLLDRLQVAYPDAYP